MAVFCFVFFACEERELIATNDFTLKVTSDKQEIDARLKSNANADDSYAVLTLKAEASGVRDELPVKVSFKSVQGSKRLTPIMGRIIVPSLSNQEFNAGEDFQISKGVLFSKEGLKLRYIADEGGEHWVGFTIKDLDDNQLKRGSVGIEVYQVPEIIDGFADLHYDFSSTSQTGANQYFVDLNVKIDHSVLLGKYDIEVKYPRSDVPQDTVIAKSSSLQISPGIVEILPNHYRFYRLFGPTVKDTLHLIDKNIKIRILDKNKRASGWFTTRLQDAEDN